MQYSSFLVKALAWLDLVLTQRNDSKQEVTIPEYFPRIKSIDDTLQEFPPYDFEPIGGSDNPKIEQSRNPSFSSEIAQKEAERILSNMIIALKELVPESGFNSTKFSTRAPMFRLYLLYASVWSKRFLPSVPFMKQLKFAQEAFQAMKKATETLRKFQSSDISQVYLSRVIILNLRLLAFYNKFGEPDKLLEDFAGVIYRHWRILEFYIRSFDELEKVRDDVKEKFFIFSSEAESRINYLTSLNCVQISLDDLIGGMPWDE